MTGRKTSTLLEKVKLFLWDGVDYFEHMYPRSKERYLCYAIGKVRLNVAKNSKEIEKLDFVQSLITKRLEDSSTYEAWLEKYHSFLGYSGTTKEFQAARLNWLNSLIAEFKQKGD